MILMPLYFQTVRGQDAVHTGLLLMPQGVGAAFAMALSGRVTERVGGGITALFGVIVTAIATLPFVFIGAETSVLAHRHGDDLPRLRHRHVDDAVDDGRVQRAAPRPGRPRLAAAHGAAARRRVDRHGDLHRRAPAGDRLPPQTAAGVASAFGNTYWWVMAVAVAALVPVIILARVERQAKARARSPKTVPAGAVPALGGSR